MQKDYNPSLIEKKWQKVWEKEGVYRPDLDKAAKPFYNLMMFPYPSAEGMHVGNMYAFTGADVYGRFQRMQGKDVFEPIGLDGFGIHSENYAIKVGNHPAKQAEISEKNFYRQLKSIGNGFDWTRTVETYKPEYYKWTQWLFIQLFKAGLAYRKRAMVNFCPSCKTVLADEQVIDGRCERCATLVVRENREQWFFRITHYAEKLLGNIEKLNWSQKVKIAQKSWIGRSEGALITFKIKNSHRTIDVFTTRPDTLFGATFLVVSPEHPLVADLFGQGKDVMNYVSKAVVKSEQERIAQGKEKEGVSTWYFAINPVNNQEIPIWIADYVLIGYGTGALFGDAHDERDVEFAKKYKIALKPTIMTGDKSKDARIKSLKECYTGEGILFDSGEFSGLTSSEAKKKIVAWLEQRGKGKKETIYHLRDWLISRQRYWGPPIPMIYCEKCSWQPVPEKDLPVKLPFIEDYKPLGTGQAPLASHPEFYKTKCPNCHGDARRETDVSDTFLDSSWYFLRYVATEFDTIPFPTEKFQSSVLGSQLSDSSQSVDQSTGQPKTDKLESENRKQKTDNRMRWLPVNMYIGGAEHSVLHLLYSRFIIMALKDLGFINFEEPFAKFRAHGLIVKDAAKMSKSKGNVVIPDEYIRKFGADTLRTYLMFAGPYSQGGDFRDSGIEGMFRFLKRVWTLLSGALVANENSLARSSHDLYNSTKEFKMRAGENFVSSPRLQMLHKTIKKVTEDIESLNYNTAIAALMEYYNFLSDQKSVNSEELETFAKLLAPFAPHVSEELFSMINDKGLSIKSIHKQAWPSYDPKFLVENEITIAVQVNGKLRETIKVTSDKKKEKSYVEQLARSSDKVKKYLENKQVKKVIYVEGKIINFVVV